MSHQSESLGCLVMDVNGLTLTAEDRELLAHPLVGGVILFARNYASRQQLVELCCQIRSVRQTPLIIMADQEGGRVQRFINEFTRLPPMGVLGRRHAAQQLTDHMIQSCGWLMAVELLSAGVDLSLAPVLDLNTGTSQVIGDRAFHSEPHRVAHLATLFMHGMQEAGMAATGKHFPGHGSVAPDSHTAMPVDTRDFAAIHPFDLYPFTHLIAQGIDALMAAHIIYPTIDDRPVGFSRHWLQTILREQLGFSGVMLSDDLSMVGAASIARYADRVVAAREAGCDFTLLCNQRSGIIQVLEEVPAAHYRIPYAKWHRLQGRLSTQLVDYQAHPRWRETQAILSECLG